LLQPTVAAYGVSDFKRGIRRDTNAYPVLNDDKHFSSWNRSVISQARAHDVSNVFDTGYTLETEEEKKLFKAKQEFGYSMFNQCVQTNTGKLIVRSHKVDFDVQAVYSKLVHTAKKSTKAQLTREKLVLDLTTNKLDSRWKGTHEGFVLMWKEKMRRLEDISPQSHHYSTEVKLSMLQNAVSLVPKLSSIRDASDNFVAIGNNPLGYQAYSELLISGCNQLDKDLEVTHSKTKRTVNYTNSKEEDYFDRGYLDSGDSYYTKENKQDNAWTILAAESSAQEKSVGALTPFFPRALWDLIPEEVRENIRNNREPTRRTRPPPPRGGPPNRGTPPDCRDSYNNGSSTRPPAQRRANVHDLASSNQEADRDEFFDAVHTNPSKLIPTVFSTNSAKQLVLTTAKESLLSLIEVLTVAWPEKTSASSSILSIRQTSVVSTTIPWLAYPLSLQQVS